MFLKIYISLEIFLAYVALKLWLLSTHMNCLYVVVQVELHAVNFCTYWTLKLLSNFIQVVGVMMLYSKNRRVNLIEFSLIISILY